MQVSNSTRSSIYVSEDGIPPLSQFQALPLNRQQVLIRWKVSDEAGSSYDIDNYDFEILRGGSSTDPFEEVGPKLQGVTEWIDLPPTLDNRWGRLYYKLRITDRNDPAKTHEFGPISVHESYGPSLEALYIIEQLNGYLHCRPVGYIAYAYTKASWGSRCSCWNYIVQRSNDDNCVDCAGTGWAYPFSAVPVKFLMGLNPRTEMVGGGDHEGHQDDRSAWTTNYPDLKKGDVVHVPSENNTIYKVEGSQWVAEERGFGVRQAFRLSPCDKDHPLYEMLQLDIDGAREYLDAIWDATKNSHYGHAGFNRDVPTSRDNVSAPGGGISSQKAWVPR